ncbi:MULTISPECIES: hypothetical protein [unclassified Myxococcus]|nr:MULTISPECIES: hypothetical protein [unclassified Myxococcus]
MGYTPAQTCPEPSNDAERYFLSRVAAQRLGRRTVGVEIEE